MKSLFVFICVFTLGACTLAQSKATLPPVETIDHVDLNSYLGKWYEIASIPQSFQKQCASDTMAEYSLAEDNLIKVYNTCKTNSGEISVAEGRAKIVDSNSNAKLKVTFVKLGTWIFAFGGNYWILDLGSNYSYSIVGDPSRNYAWILSRNPSLSTEQLTDAEKSLRANGYDTCKILTSIQDGGNQSTRMPLCKAVKE